MKKCGAEFIGTFWLVLGGCGSAVLAAAFPNVGIGLLGVALAFGLTVLTMAFAIGHISGCHLNPAVSIGLWAGGRFPGNQAASYIVSQVLGAVVAGACSLYHRQRQDGFRCICRLRFQRVRCPFPRGIFPARRFGDRDRHDHDVPPGHPRCNRQPRSAGLCTVSRSVSDSR